MNSNAKELIRDEFRKLTTYLTDTELIRNQMTGYVHALNDVGFITLKECTHIINEMWAWSNPFGEVKT